MSKNIILAINSKYVHTNIAVRYIKAYVEKYSNEKLEIVEMTINNRLSEIIKKVYKKNPENLFVSTYIWNKEYVFKLIKELKKIMPNCRIILGGPEVSYSAKDLMMNNDSIDCIISGEGESIITKFLTKNINDVLGVYYRKDNNILYNGDAQLICDLDEIPFPYSDEELYDSPGKIFYYESSRGCPFKCSYCMSSIDKRVRYFSLDRIKEDMIKFKTNGISLIKFIDRTFNLNKEHYISVWNYLLSIYDEKLRFHFEISADLFDEEVLSFMEKVPKEYFQFEIGVQTINPESLRAINRKNDLKKIEETVKRVGANIHLHLDLIAGLPYEDYGSFKQSFNYVFNLYPDMLQLGFLKILSGTQISTEVNEYGFKYQEFPPYEILYNDFISYDEILRLKDVEEVLDIYYNSHKFKESIKFIVENYYESSFDFFEEMADYFDRNGYYDISHKIVRYFEIVYDFIEDKKFENFDLFKDILKFDYLAMGKTGSYPHWMNKYVDKERYNEVLKDMDFKSIREGHKMTELEKFSYNVLTKERVDWEILFVYGKRFEIKEL